MPMQTVPTAVRDAVRRQRLRASRTGATRPALTSSGDEANHPPGHLPFRERYLATGLRFRRGRSLGPGQRVHNVLPQLPPSASFGFGQATEGLRPAHPSEFGGS